MRDQFHRAVLGTVFGIFALVGLLAPVHGQDVAPDEVLLKDGSKIVGTIESMAGGKLKVTTGSAGTLEINFADIESIRSSKDHTFQLTDGTRYVGKPRAGANGGIAIETALSGTVPLDPSTVEALNPPEKKAVTHKGSVFVGGRITDGNTRTKSASAVGNYEARGDDHRLTFRGDWNYEEARGALTARNASGRLKYDLFISEDTFFYANASFEGDDFADLNLRTTVGAGVGRQFYEEENFKFFEEAGISFFDEDFETGSDFRFTAARVAGSMEWAFDPGRIVFFHNHEIFFGFEDQDDLYADTQTGVRLTIVKNFTANFLVNFSWDNTPAPGNRRTDTEYVWGLGYTFSF